MTQQSKPGSMISDLGGLRPRDRVAVYYDGDDHLRDRLLLYQTGPTRWIIVTPHGDLYEEDMRSYHSIFSVGKSGGVGVVLLVSPRVRFKQADIHAGIVDWLA